MECSRLGDSTSKDQESEGAEGRLIGIVEETLYGYSIESGQRGQRKNLEMEAEDLLIRSVGNGEGRLFKRWNNVIRFHLKEIMMAAVPRLYWAREGQEAEYS